MRSKGGFCLELTVGCHGMALFDAALPSIEASDRRRAVFAPVVGDAPYYMLSGQR